MHGLNRRTQDAMAQAVLSPWFYNVGAERADLKTPGFILRTCSLLLLKFVLICYLLEITTKNKNGALVSHCLNAYTNMDKNFRRSYHFHQL